MSRDGHRPAWAETDPLLKAYHDQEWRVESHDSRYLFEMLCMATYRNGLNWMTVIKKRAAFEQAFHNYEVLAIAAMDDHDFEELMENDQIIRNRRKLQATIKNAKVVRKLAEQGENFDHYLWRFVDFKPVQIIRDRTKPFSDDELVTRVVQQMKQDGFTLIGSVTIFGFMVSVGMIQVPNPDQLAENE